ncbi:sigma-70 family RNA polymerase sigma factor [Solirubrobacter soli]|uniref:sigma-70 family RNA polymerase sigma factor n=1 Tax=Solirubrobacter soli TaxID=363832 RepID=UPI000407B642|nr:sigma-70 family RNA polymerase sigma factor [Solirubrobacter soli]
MQATLVMAEPGSPAWRDPLRRDAERVLFAQLTADRDPAAREAIVRHFMPLARHLARRYQHAEDLEDLEQVAALGLVKAVDRFQPERGLAFTSFAFPTILGELKRHLRDHGWSVRPPRGVQELAARVGRHAADLHAELGRSAAPAELAKLADSTVEHVLEALQAATARHALSLDQTGFGDAEQDTRRFEVAIDEAGFATAEDAALLEVLMRALPERERLVLHLRFNEDLTQSRIGEIVGVSQMHVSRIVRNSLEQLRVAASDERSPSCAPAERYSPRT